MPPTECAKCFRKEDATAFSRPEPQSCSECSAGARWDSLISLSAFSRCLSFPGFYPPSRSLQRDMPPVYTLEHLVSEIPCESLVYSLRQCAMPALALVCMLSRRRLVSGNSSSQDRILRIGPDIHHGDARAQQINFHDKIRTGRKMNKPKNIKRPDSSIALPLKPAQLNKLRLSCQTYCPDARTA